MLERDCDSRGLGKEVVLKHRAVMERVKMRVKE
jgi:hypothetical protein